MLPFCELNLLKCSVTCGYVLLGSVWLGWIILGAFHGSLWSFPYIADDLDDCVHRAVPSKTGTQLWQCPSVIHSCSVPWEPWWQGKWEAKGKPHIDHLCPTHGMSHLFKCLLFFLFFFQLSSFNSLEGDWRLPKIWRSWILLRCQASWMWLADDYDGCALCTWGHRSLNITPISICFCLSTITYGSQWNVGIEGK